MTFVTTLIPGQISVPNYTDPALPSGGGGGGGGGGTTTIAWDPGQYAKIEQYQYNEAMVANHSHMPNPYQPNNTAHADTIWGELDRNMWMKGITVFAEWGKIEKTPGVFTWTFVDFVLDTVRNLTRPTGQGKKVMLNLDLMHPASLAAPVDSFPPDLMTQPSANGGYYKDPAAFPPAQTSPIVNAKKFNHCWCYESADPNVGGAVMPRGYNFNCYKFTAAAGTNTLKTRYYAFLDALAARYKDDPVFAGIIFTEAAIATPFVAYEPGNSRNNHYDGRKNLVKYAKSIFPNRIVAECVNFDNQYYLDMTAAGVTDGLIANKLAFTTANIHTGTNLKLGNINPVLEGNVPIIMQVQPLDMKTMSGNRDYYNWPTAPAQILQSDNINYNDPPTGQWMMDRIKYYNANYVIIQRNYESLTPPNLNWTRWKTYMNASIYANDAAGGMITTKPQFIA